MALLGNMGPLSNGQPGEIAELRNEIAELRELIDSKMERYVIRLTKIGDTYKMSSLDDTDLTFTEVYNMTKQLNKYVVIVYGNNKLRPQYISTNEMMFIGLDRSTESKILRIIYTPTRLDYQSFKLVEA